jgi:acyl-CoA dehydrogenase
MSVLDIDHLRSWVGKTEQVDDLIAPSKVAALAATLDRDDPAPRAGDALPPPWHWTLCVAAARQSAIGPDGHPARGGFLPPVPLPRRMWAGGRLSFPRPLRVGEAVQRRSRVMSVEYKSGRSGELVFVLVRHEFHGAAGLCITEEHDIVYRDMPSADAAPPNYKPAPTDHAWERQIVPDDVLLFRYSALTFNGHRIHYDRRYVTEVEGYPGLIVHGPLIATQDIRDAVRDLCAQFPDEYFRKVDEERGYPEAFVDALTKAGWMAALIPQEYGGSGLGLTEASGDHGRDQPLRRQFRRLPRPDVQHGHAAAPRLEAQKSCTCPDRHRRAAPAEHGRDRAHHRHRHHQDQDHGGEEGRPLCRQRPEGVDLRIQHSDLMILLARTTPLAEVKKKSEGMSIFIVDLRDAIGKGLTVRPIPNMVNHETNELFFDNLEIPAENLIGEEGKGFKYILDGLNAERTLIAAECIGDGYWFIDRVSASTSSERVVFGGPSARTRACSSPSPRAYIEVEAANLMRWEACACSTPTCPAARRPTWPSTWRPRPAGRRPTPASSSTAASASPANTTSSASSARRGCTRWRRSRPT